MNMKHSVTVNDESHFVFFMQMFAAEFREHGIEAGSLPRDVDHIGGYVSTSRLELVDLFGVCRENFFL